MLFLPNPCDQARVHLGFSECSLVLSWPRSLWGLVPQDDSWDLEINITFIFWINLEQPGVYKMLPCSENHLPEWVEQWACHWISAWFHWLFLPSSKDGSNWLQMTQGRAGASKWVIVDALLYKEDATDLLDHIKNKKLKTCSLMFTRTLRAKISIFQSLNSRIRVSLLWTVQFLLLELNDTRKKAGEVRQHDECSKVYILVWWRKWDEFGADFVLNCKVTHNLQHAFKPRRYYLRVMTKRLYYKLLFLPQKRGLI